MTLTSFLGIQIRWLTCAIATLSFSQSAFGDAKVAKICNKTPVPVRISTVIHAPESGQWEIHGWYRADPGECVHTRKNSAEKTYFIADSVSDDIVVRSLEMQNSVWGGEEEDGDPMICVTNDRHGQLLQECPAGWTPRRYESFAGTTQNLTCSDCGLDINTLEEAGIAYRRLQGQIRYGESTKGDPVGTPFRIGLEIEADDQGPYITKVYDGMPAALSRNDAGGSLRPGDRIVRINGTFVKSVYDAIFLMQQIGYKSDPKTRVVLIDALRWTNRESQPQVVTVPIPVSYFRALDDRIDVTSGKTAGLNLVDGALWGFAPQARCGVSYLLDAYNDVPEHLREQDCVSRLQKERDRGRELHSDMWVFDLAGSMTSPRFLLKLGARSAARSGVRNLTRRTLLAAADEGLQGAISEVGWARGLTDVSAPAMLDSVKVGVITGGIVGFVFR